MSTFPLYDTLCNDINGKEYEKDLTATLKKNMIKKIESLDQDTIELIYALICHYQEQFKETDNCILPYQGKYTNETDISFDLDLFPIKLKHILLKFINIHSGRINITDFNTREHSPCSEVINSISESFDKVYNQDIEDFKDILSIDSSDIIETSKQESTPIKESRVSESDKKSPKNKKISSKKSKDNNVTITKRKNK